MARDEDEDDAKAAGRDDAESDPGEDASDAGKGASDADDVSDADKTDAEDASDADKTDAEDASYADKTDAEDAKASAKAPRRAEKKRADRKKAHTAEERAAIAIRKAVAEMAERPKRGRKLSAATKHVEATIEAEAVASAASPSPAAVAAAQRAAKRALAAGATLAAIGIALVGVGPSDAGTAVVLGGLIALIYGIHTFGRLGPETPAGIDQA